MSEAVCYVVDAEARLLAAAAVPPARTGTRRRRRCDCAGCRYFRHYGFECVLGRHLDRERWS